MPRIAVFLHGTAIMHPSGAGVAREERVAQVRQQDPDVRRFADHVPVGSAVEKLSSWASQGAEIVYLSSHRRPDDVYADRAVVVRHRFPPGPVEARLAGEDYGALAARVAPDLLVEDDCESIGGREKTIAACLPPAARARIGTIVVPEFGGIDHLPDALDALVGHRPERP